MPEVLSKEVKKKMLTYKVKNARKGSGLRFGGFIYQVHQCLG